MLDLNLSEYLSSSRSVIKMVNALCIGLIEAGTVNLKEICARFKTGTEKTNYRAIQRFFEQKSLHDSDVINYVINNLFSNDEKLTLAIDRTDWEFGETRHNLLIVSVLYANTAVPLMTLPLERKGNSNPAQRMHLLDTILSIIPRHRIKAIIGDREFMGEAWFGALRVRHLPFVMRIRSNIQIEKDNFRGAVRDFPCSKEPLDHGKVYIGTRILSLSTSYSKGGLVAVISDNVKNPLKLYKQRWGIETGFKCLKTNGFNLEDTHLKHSDRIITLVQICTLAMTFSLHKIKNTVIKIVKKNTDIPQYPASHMQEDA